MERLLKIVEGPMKGAEAALVVGTRVKVGSGEDCDIVIADATLPSLAFELDVSEDAVSVVTPDGETSDLADFEIREFGSTCVAVGPAEGAWGELRRPMPKVDEPAAPDPAEKKDDGGPANEAPASEERAGGRHFRSLVALLVLIVVLLALLFLGYRHRDRLSSVVGRSCGVFARGDSAGRVEPGQRQSVDEIAKTYGLKVENRGGQTFLVGNLKRRTERLAIRAMALASDRMVRFDLTDDQSLKNAVSDTLFIATEGRLKVLSVTNRVAEIAGPVTGPQELATVLSMLNQDVPQLVACRTGGVKVGAAVIARSAAQGEAVGDLIAPQAVAPKRVLAPSAPKLPVAGILTTPYPCVVLTDGSRCLEGARIGGFVLERIDAEELVFRAGETELKWRPSSCTRKLPGDEYHRQGRRGRISRGIVRLIAELFNRAVPDQRYPQGSRTDLRNRCYVGICIKRDHRRIPGTSITVGSQASGEGRCGYPSTLYHLRRYRAVEGRYGRYVGSRVEGAGYWYCRSA